MITTYLIACVILILFSAFFSSVEIALLSLNRLRLQKLAESGKKGAQMAERIEDRSTEALTTILIGNNVVNIVLSSLSTIITLELLGKENEALVGVVSTLVSTVVLLIFGEIIPKLLGKNLALPYACVTAYPLRALMVIFYPLTALVMAFVRGISRLWKKDEDEEKPIVTEEELATIIETVEEEGVIDEDSGELLQSALEFSDITVEQILTPRVDVQGIDCEDAPADILSEVMDATYSRFPFYRDSLDHIEGVFYIAPFLKAVAEVGIEQVDPQDYVRETCYVHKTTKLPDAMEKMREMKVHMIVVLDEYGGTLGIVTMEDILEEIVGDIWDETDTIELEIEKTAENTYAVLGQTNIEEFFDEIDFRDREFESEYTTMGGWAVEMLEEDVHEGDSFTYKNLYVIVSEMGENVVERLTVIVAPPEEEKAEKEEKGKDKKEDRKAEADATVD